MSHAARVAIVGMSCRFPGAPDVRRFWRLLCDGVEAVRRFSDAELEAAGVDLSTRRRPDYVPACAALDGIEDFDAAFFGVPPREAEIMDPQHRIFLELAWEALEDAGYDPEQYDGRIGVYAGAGLSTYLLHNLLPFPDLRRYATPFQLLMANNKDFVPTRVSYRLNLRGPSLSVNTACSTSLVAVHVACQALLGHECDIALAGGIGVQVPQDRGYVYEPEGILSPDGRCRAFAAGAAGTVSGNGGGIVVLKRLEDAAADRDTVRAVILGTAVNNDGAAKAGYTAPSLDGQAGVIAEALAVADVPPDSIGYIEAHGTGTAVGDPIEVRALARVFRRGEGGASCAIGSVKSNVGHLDEGAGVAGLIKTVLALEHGRIPPSLHFDRPNPECHFESTPFYVSTTLGEWTARGDSPRRAGVSSFGIGGTNAHVVIEERAAARHDAARRPWQVVVLSGRSPQALAGMQRALADTLAAIPAPDLADVAYTLQVGRRGFRHRRAFACRTIDEAVRLLRADLRAVAARDTDTRAPAATGRRVVFMFPGQGSQYAGMARGLYETEPAFRSTFDACAEQVLALGGGDIRPLVYPSAPGEAAEHTLAQTSAAQPALFAVQYALAGLWRQWGIEPCALVGHSLGEYVAWSVAGMLSMPDALRLVVRRAELMQELPRGAMLAVQLSESAVRSHIDEDASELAVAAVNGVDSCVVSGREVPVRGLAHRLDERGIQARPLNTSHAFHSAMMAPAGHRLAEEASSLRVEAPSVPVISNVSGTWLTSGEAADPRYWARHLVSTVRFADGVGRIARDHPGAMFLEVGPGRTLARHVQHQVGPASVVASLPHRSEPKADHEVLLGAVARLWEAGAPVTWTRFAEHDRRRRVPLPTYPFERKRYWIDPPREEPAAPTVVPSPSAVSVRAGMLGAGVEAWLHQPVWERTDRRPARGAAPDTIVVFAPREAAPQAGWADAISRTCGARGSHVVTVVPADSYGRRDAWTYAVRPGEAADYVSLLSDVAGDRRRLPSHFVHLWLLTGAREIGNETLLQHGFDSLLGLARALGARVDGRRVDLVAVTDGAQAVHESDAVRPEKSAVTGLLRVIALEYPSIVCRHIDIPPDGPGDLGAVDVVVEDVLGRDLDDLAAAWRGGDRLVPSVRPLELRDERGARRDVIRNGGVYLITGGLGSMGLAFAEWIAGRAASTLVLTSHRRDGLASAGSRPALRDTAARDVLSRPAPSVLAPDTAAALDRLCGRLVLEYVASLGIDLHGGLETSEEALRLALGIASPYDRMFEWCLQVLAEDGAIERRNGTVFGRWSGGGPNGADLAAHIAAGAPQLAGLADLLVHCARHMPEVLAGQLAGTEVLYPDGTTRFLDETASRIGEYSSDWIYLDAVGRYVAEAAAGARDCPLKVIEVGGGAGTLTDAVFRHLGDTPVEYTFTDISRAFVARAEFEARSRGLTSVAFRQLDISRPPRQQGCAEHAYDLVIAYNVVHATPDLRQTFRHLRGLLTGGGRLCLVETTKTRRWDQIIWGLTTGWWAFDEGLRSGSPLMDLDRWARLVGECGFDEIETAPAGEDARHAADAGLIVARAPDRPEVPEEIAARLAAIEARGSRVHVAPVDVTDAGQVSRMVAGLRERFGRVDGVIHTAGAIGRGFIRDKTVSEARGVLGPKLGGARALEAALGDVPPDFFVLCSSIASRAPVAGQADYAAANAALDAFAHAYRRRTGARAIAIGWGFWQELGMIAKSAMPKADQQRIVDDIRARGWTSAGVEAFETILLRSEAPEVLVCPHAPPDRRARAVRHPMLRDRQDGAGYTSYRVRLEDEVRWVVDEHRVGGLAVLPGTAYLEIARAAYEDLCGASRVELRDSTFVQPYIHDRTSPRELRLVLQDRDGRADYVVVSAAGENRWELHARGEIVPIDGRDAVGAPTLDMAAVPEADDGLPPEFARRLSGFGPHWDNVRAVRFDGNTAAAVLTLPPSLAHEADTFVLHPALLDNATGYFPISRHTTPRVPFSYESVKVHGALGGTVVSRANARGEAGTSAETFDVVVCDDRGRVRVEVRGYSLRPLPIEPAHSAEDGRNASLELAARGALDTLAFAEAGRDSLDADEVEVRVEAAGINFIEVLYALGMLPDPTRGVFPFGLECAGVVTRTGRNVRSVQEGQPVAVFANGAARLFMKAPERLVAPVPAGLSHEEAATIPAAYMTAYTALIERGGLQPGERVLVHSACGGVGLAAVNVARWRGAEILATAGTKDKRAYLRALGIRTVMDSRSGSFAAETLVATGGEGVDVVLNSLSGELIDRGLSVLRPDGRFLELGKRDILEGGSLSLRHFERRLSYIAIDVGPGMRQFPRVWQEVWRHVESGAFAPLPRRVVPAVEAAGAFADMARGRHIGKFVLSLADRPAIRRQAAFSSRSARRGRPLEEILGLAAAPATRARESTGHAAAAPSSNPAAGVPQTDVERAIAAIWEDLLGASSIGRDDDFFSLNGDSLLGAQVISRIHRTFGARIPLSAIFDEPTVAKLAVRVQRAMAAAAPTELAPVGSGEEEEGVI